MEVGEIDSRIAEFSKLIKSVIMKLSPHIDRMDLDDIEQEIKIKIWKELMKSEKKINNLGSYIWKVSYTTACRMLKDLSKQNIIPINESTGDHELYTKQKNDLDDQPDFQFEKTELYEAIEKSVELLKDSRRQVIKLYLLGMNRNEISSFYGWSQDRVRNLLYRGLDDLRKNLRSDGVYANLRES